MTTETVNFVDKDWKRKNMYLQGAPKKDLGSARFKRTMSRKKYGVLSDQVLLKD